MHVYTLLYAEARTLKLMETAASPPAKEMSAPGNQKMYFYERIIIFPFVNDSSILKGPPYTSTNQINPFLQPGLIICPISALFGIN